MQVIRGKEFTGKRAWEALEVAELNGITVRLHWTDQPYKWHVNDGEEVVAVLDDRVEMRYREAGTEKSVLLNAGDIFHATLGTAHVAHPLGEALSLRNAVAPISIKLGDFHPDNLHGLPDGRLLIAGQMGKASGIVNCSGGSTCTVGSMIVMVDPRSRAVWFRWAVASTPTFAAASTALLYGPDHWASSFRGDRLVRLGPAPRHILRVTPP